MGNNRKQMLGNKEIDSMIGSSNQINIISHAQVGNLLKV
jgi:hypothetical protein